MIHAEYPVIGISRKQRHPQYSDAEMMPFFKQISKGYCCEQSADICLYPRGWALNTIYSDDEVFEHILNLSMIAGARIRAGEQSAPDRYDGLYEQTQD